MATYSMLLQNLPHHLHQWEVTHIYGPHTIINTVQNGFSAIYASKRTQSP